MRAKEFVTEYKQYPTREYEGVTFTMMEKDGQLIVKALNDFGLPMGHVVFGIDGKELDPKDLEVYDKYQGQGIARVMYDYIKSQGFTINRSFDQTDAGRGFWDKHRGEDSYVWEDRGQGAAGIVLYAEDTGRYGLQQRSNTINDPGLWAAWGGGREAGESLEQCALRELAEEGGYTGPIKLKRIGENAKYVTFIGVVPHEFEPRANDEWQDYCWVEAGDWPEPMHPGTAAALKNIPVSENFADGKVRGKSRPGRVKRAGASCDGSVSDLRARAKRYGGERGKMYHWCANMKSGRSKTNEEKIAQAKIGPFDIGIDDHVYDREQERKVSMTVTDNILRKLKFPRVINKIRELDIGQKFWLFDSRANVALGIRKLGDDKLYFKTVWNAVRGRPTTHNAVLISI